MKQSNCQSTFQKGGQEGVLRLSRCVTTLTFPGKSLLQGDGKHVPANLSNPGSWSSADSILAMDQMFTSGRAVGVSPSSLRVFCRLIES